MGLSIHYNGKFNQNANLSELIAEVKDIAETFKWDYHIFNQVFPANKLNSFTHNGELYGICFTPPGCETVSICFLSNYWMSAVINLKFYGKSNSKPETDYLYMISVKTQFAEILIHKTIIQMFRHLLKKGYFAEFNMSDEGEYWETGDEDLLEKKFNFLGSMIDNFSIALESIPKKSEETFESYFERIIKRIQKRNVKK